MQFKERRKHAFQKAKVAVQIAYSQKDNVLVQAIRSIDEVNESKSLLSERLFEWFKFNFPELPELEDEEIAGIILEFGSKEKFSEKLSKIVSSEMAQKILKRAKESYGPAFTDLERSGIQVLAKQVLDLSKAKDGLEGYVSNECKEYMKNACAIVEPLVVARLLSKAGALQRLARMPASTIQLLGAENALFKHLKTNSKPPKHGVIIQSQLLRSAPLKKRGKLARALANTLSTAFKADYYTQHFIADNLKKKLEAKTKLILSKN